MTERFCCDGKCNANQGRGSCPRFQQESQQDSLTVGEWLDLGAAVVVGFITFCALVYLAYQLVMYWMGK